MQNTNIRQRIQAVSKESDSECLEGVMKYHTLQGYGKSFGHIGFDGYIECLKARQEIELSILNKLKIEKLVIENPFDVWARTYSTIKKFMDDMIIQNPILQKGL
ncbi:MAG: hypothetical protein ACRDBX_01010 [Erysipelotrichaceae bacterium]